MNLKTLIRRLENINLDAIIMRVMQDRDIQNRILSLNRFDQLFDLGVDSTGKPLSSIGGPYSENTIEGIPGAFPGKKELGLPVDHVTLFQFGEFYETFFINLFLGGFEIGADFAIHGVDLRGDWGDNITGLTAESKQKLEFLIPFIVREYYKELGL